MCTQLLGVNLAVVVNDTGVRPGKVLAAVCLGYGMIIVDTTIVNVAIPTMQASLRTGIDTMQLVVDGYVVILASLLLAGAALSDRFGASKIFRAGVALFGIASALCGVAPNGPFLVAARMLQGLGAVLLVPSSLLVLTAAYTDAKARARAIAVWATVAGSPAAFGPILGGLVVDTLGWRSIFYVNVPLAAIALLLTQRGLPALAPNKSRRQDVPGQLLAVLILSGLALALTEGHQQGWTAPLPVIAFAVAVAAGAAFAVRQRTAAEPMLPADLLRAPGFRGFASVGVLLFAGYYGMVFVLSVYLQDVRHFAPWQAGLSFLPSALPITLMPLVAGRLVGRIGPARVLVAGLVLTVAGGAALALFGGSGMVPLSVALFLLGCGFGLSAVPQITLVMETAPAGRTALASGLLNAARQSGTVLGVAVLGGLQTGGGLGTPSFVATAMFVAMLVFALAAARALRQAAARRAEREQLAEKV
ncbi:MFS transporter [Amycolatopsis albidoflavus]